MNRRLRHPFLCLLAGLLLPAAVSAGPVAAFSLPTPPRQSAPWTPPAGLPAPLVSATTTLFEEGLADPRGGDYRQISVRTGIVWAGTGDVFPTHGWVLPSANGPHFAVCWNGLVYPVVSVGDRADLNADVLALIQADADARAAQEKANPTEPYSRGFRFPPSEHESLSETSLLPLKVCLLARLGEGELARKFWDDWLEGTPPAYRSSDETRRDPYLLLADEWVRALYDRAVSAHQSGKDDLSVADARQLAALQPVVEAEAGRRGYKRPLVYRAPGEADKSEPPYFGFLEALPRLRTDEERRVADTTPPPALADILAMPDKAARVAALIRALDQVSVQQQSEPGGVEPDDSPIVLALIAQGDDAVEPLIHTLAADTRLTRSVGFGHGSQPGAMLSVAGAAYAALVDILHTSEFSPAGSSLGRAEAAAAIQAYWDKSKGLSVPERWYRTLADDSAGPAQWLDAAHEIIRPSDEQVRGGWIVRGPGFDGAAPPNGESLRRGHAPSVSALMARRAGSLVTNSGASDNDSQQVFDAENATTMALYLTAWDPRAARPVLRAQFGAERRTIAVWKGRVDIREDTLQLTNLTLARMHSGDPTALTDYVTWLQATPLDDFPIFSLSDILEPLWRAPNDPAVRRGAAFLFGDSRSPWVPLVQERPGGLYGSEFEKLLESPLLDLASFRRAMLAALTDRAVIQTVTLGGPDRQADYNIMGNDTEVDPFRPATPQAFPVRRCDLYAWRLSHLGGMPAFKYDWPTAKKDAAVAAAAERLRRYGGRFASKLPPVLPAILPGEGGAPRLPAPMIRFPRRTQPATAGDVAQNRAIFALGDGARVWPLPDFPLAAQWVTDRRYPRPENVWMGGRKFQTVIGHVQDGFVWQAEETAAGRRFYGFVGTHDIARVPAEDMEFPPADGYAWVQVSAGLDGGVRDGAGRPLPYTLSLRAGRPLPLTIRLRSRKGVAQTVPADFLRRQMTLKLLFSADDPGAEPRPPTDPGRTWEEVRPRRPLPVPPAHARTLEPAEEFAAWRLDPSDCFDLYRPGTYRIQFNFTPATRSGQMPEAAFRVVR